MTDFDAVMIAEGCMPPPGDTSEEQEDAALAHGST
jgi:hypothetical protein